MAGGGDGWWWVVVVTGGGGVCVAGHVLFRFGAKYWYLD